MKFKVWGESLPELTLEGESANAVLLKAKRVNQGYMGVTPIKETPQDRYLKNKTKQIALRFNIVSDADIIEFLETVPNKQGLIKKLIRDELNRNKS